MVQHPHATTGSNDPFRPSDVSQGCNRGVSNYVNWSPGWNKLFGAMIYL
jgi:hypothetical protein